MEQLTRDQQRILDEFAKLTNLFKEKVEGRAPLDHIHAVADEIAEIRREGYEAGIDDLDFRFHFHEALRQNAAYFTSGSKTYRTDDLNITD